MDNTLKGFFRYTLALFCLCFSSASYSDTTFGDTNALAFDLTSFYSDSEFKILEIEYFLAKSLVVAFTLL